MGLQEEQKGDNNKIAQQISRFRQKIKYKLSVLMMIKQRKTLFRKAKYNKYIQRADEDTQRERKLAE